MAHRQVETAPRIPARRGTSTAVSKARMGTRKRKARRLVKEPVKLGGSGVHGKGVFATRRIRKGERIIEYSGEHISWKKAQQLPAHDPENPHHTVFFALDDGNVINPAVGGNEAQWINHSCAPNCETDEEHGRIFVFACRDLEKGAELFFDYRLEPADRRTKKLERLFRCDCGSSKCRGTMLGPSG